jgi:hypothetical protein
MTCDSITKLIPLYYYGELTPEDEDQMDQHLHECAACSLQMEQQRKLAAALDERHTEIPAFFLDECREDLMAAIAGGAPRQVQPVKGPWALFLEAMGSTLAGFGRLRQPVGAVALVLLGFLVARFSGVGNSTAAMLPSDNVISTVRDVKAEKDGRVRIQLADTRNYEVSGRLEDENIRRLILAGSRDHDAAVRVVSVGLMKSLAESPQVLDSLLNALQNDPNDGVRLSALDGLKQVAGDTRVTKALSQVLLNDGNAAVRQGAIDLLVMRRDDSTVPLLQNLMQREDDSGVRLKASKILKDWNASIGTF